MRDRLRGATYELCGALVRASWQRICWWGAIGPSSKAGRRFGRFGQNSIICFPANTIFNEHYIRIGEGTMIGPHVTLSAGMLPGQQCLTDSVVRIGDRCLIGKGSGIVGHLSIDIGDDVWTGHNVYITDQNHGYDDITRPISQQTMPERPVVIGDEQVRRSDLRKVKMSEEVFADGPGGRRPAWLPTLTRSVPTSAACGGRSWRRRRCRSR